MGTFHIVLLLATLLCSLVAGFVLAFAFIVMPGLGTLSDREFLHAFQVMDRVIQNNHPVFILVWVGSVLALVASVLLGVRQLEGSGLLILVLACVIYLVGVQLPTIIINVPLNNQLQTLDVQVMDEAALAEARRDFEPPWNRWNLVRTVLATLTCGLLMILLLHQT